MQPIARPLVLSLLMATCPAVAATADGRTNSLGMKFAPVPGTPVLFSIWETRVRDFAVFADATGHATDGNVYSLDPADGQWKVHSTNSWRSPGFPQTPDHPVVNVSWNDVQAFCAWITAHERSTGSISLSQEYRLPTDAEWSLAAGPGLFPWGDQWPPPPGSGNFHGAEQADPKRPIIAGYNDDAPFPAVVGNFAPNVRGLYDLAGNAPEWCADFYRKEMNPADIRAERPGMNHDAGGNKYRTLRGGGWVDGLPVVLRSDSRTFGEPQNRYCVGFRLVLAPVNP